MNSWTAFLLRVRFALASKPEADCEILPNPLLIATIQTMVSDSIPLVGQGAVSEVDADVEQNSRLADFDALTMDGVGHFPMLEAPREFQALLERWIAELGPRPETTPR